MTGSGTADNPYTVASVADFRALDDKSGYVVMTDDVDFNSAGGRVSFAPIICSNTIHFDGQGHIIRNFYQETSGDGGLFKYFTGDFKNCRILDAYILAIGGGNIGIISNSISLGSSFSNVTITGMINATSGSCNTGGFGGKADKNITFTDCKSVLNIQAQNYAGGFLGTYIYNANGGNTSFKNCISACRIYKGSHVSGYIGYASTNDDFDFNGCISQCDFRGGTKHSGFMIGRLATYTNCASICTMTGASYAYGISDSLKKCIQSYSKCIFDGCKNTYGIGNGPKNQSYAACTLKNVPDNAVNYGLGSGDNYISYYDGEIFADTEGSDGAVTTAQLKSADWLREQGWAI